MQGQQHDSSEAAVQEASHFSNVSSSSRPINPEGPLGVLTSRNSFSQGNLENRYCNSDTKYEEKEFPVLKARHRPLTLKRKSSSEDGRVRAKRRMPEVSMSPSSPFDTLKVTKLSVSKYDIAKKDVTNHYVAQATMGSPLKQSRHLLQATIMDHLIPCQTYDEMDNTSMYAPGSLYDAGRITKVPNIQTHDNVLRVMHADDPAGIDLDGNDNLGRPALGSLTGLSYNAVSLIYDSDDYGFYEEPTNDMVRIADEVLIVSQDGIPPSSIADRRDHDSRSAEEYDPNLHCSSQEASSSELHASCHTRSTNQPKAAPEDLLDNDVDWDAVYLLTKSMAKDPSLVGSGEITAPQFLSAFPHTGEPEATLQTDERKKVPPFTRPPFQTKYITGRPYLVSPPNLSLGHVFALDI
ncbi:hypothetical protein TruAng_009934 [Truncatella angustata]|nr:hypothetical protein TruAng_009934 [Truncatella angustata]